MLESQSDTPILLSLSLMIKGLRGEPTRDQNCFMLNPSSGIQITMGHQTIAVPNVLFCDKSQ